MVTFLFGAGAIEGAWNPIIDAVKESGLSNVTASSVNSLFSRLIYRIRRENDIIKINNTYKSDILADDIQLLNIIKDNIKNQLMIAYHNKKLKCRDVVDIALNKHAEKYTHINIITTNWDKMLEHHLREVYGISESPFYIHGSVDTELYVPAETSLDPHKTAYNSTKHELDHAAMLKCIAHNTHHLIIVGCALNDLDPELVDIIATGIGNSTTLTKITIYDKTVDTAKSIKDKIVNMIYGKSIEIFTPVH